MQPYVHILHAYWKQKFLPQYYFTISPLLTPEPGFNTQISSRACAHMLRPYYDSEVVLAISAKCYNISVPFLYSPHPCQDHLKHSMLSCAPCNCGLSNSFLSSNASHFFLLFILPSFPTVLTECRQLLLARIATSSIACQLTLQCPRQRGHFASSFLQFTLRAIGCDRA